jgi:hypothetical protein
MRALHLERLEEIDEDGADFWRDLDGVSPTRRHEFIEPLASRLRPFLRPPMVKRIFGQTERTLDLAQAMDDGEIILINLKPGNGVLSELTARVIGTLLVNEFYTSCFRRKNIDEREVPHYLVIDECQLFLTPDIANILDGSRKFGLYLTLAHQHLGHLREAGEHIFQSVLTNTRIKCVFGGLPPDDAEYLARLMWRGHFDLQQAKPKLMRPQVVGHRLVWLAQEGESRGTAHSVGANWSTGRSETESTGEAQSWASGVTRSSSASKVAMAASSEGASAGEVYVPGEGLLLGDDPVRYTAGTSGVTAASSGTASAEGHAETNVIGGARSHARAVTSSSQRGGSVADTTSRAESRGRSQAFEPIYEIGPGPTWSLEEEIHKRSVSLANTKIGEMHVRVGNKRPRRLTTPYVTETSVSAERLGRVSRELLLAAPYVTDAARAETEYRAHRAGLRACVRAAPEQEPASPAFDDLVGRLKARGADVEKAPANEEPD